MARGCASMHNKLHRCCTAAAQLLHCCCTAAAAATDRATTLWYTSVPCTATQQVSLCSFRSCGLFWNISICMPTTPTRPLATIALCAVCYFYRGDMYATCSHLIHSRPSTWFMRSQIFWLCELWRLETCRLQGCCSFWGALRTVSPDKACNLYFELASVKQTL